MDKKDETENDENSSEEQRKVSLARCGV